MKGLKTLNRENCQLGIDNVGDWSNRTMKKLSALSKYDVQKAAERCQPIYSTGWDFSLLSVLDL